MTRFIIAALIICTLQAGCASTSVIRSFSKIDNAPIQEVKSTEIFADGSYKLCVLGKLRKDGFGEYQISIPQERIEKSGFRCRDNKPVKKNDRYYCAEGSFTIHTIWAKDEDILWHCQTANESLAFKYRTSIKSQNHHQTLLVQDINNQDVAEIYVDEVWESTNPVAYLFMPFTVAFDVVTFPIQALIGLNQALGH